MSLATYCVTLQKASLILSFLEKQLPLRAILFCSFLDALNCRVSVLALLARVGLVYPPVESVILVSSLCFVETELCSAELYINALYSCRKYWSCPRCDSPYPTTKIEQLLVRDLQKLSMGFVLQDLSCTKCKLVSRSFKGLPNAGEFAGKNCKCRYVKNRITHCR